MKPKPADSPPTARTRVQAGEAPGLPTSTEGVDRFIAFPNDSVLHAVEGLPGTIVVLGAGGKMGLHLCLMLAQAAWKLGRKLRIVAVSRFRTLRDRSDFEAAGVETIAADLSVPSEVEALPDSPLVFFLAGVKFGTSSSPGLLEKMNVHVPRLVASRYALSRIVAFSTGCVYPFVTPGSGGATEETPPSPVGAYARSCFQREQAFAEAARSKGTRVTLVRLNYSVEFRYGVLVDIALAVREGRPVNISTGHVNVIWQGDAIAHIIQSAQLAAAPAAAINVAGAEILRVRDLAFEFGRWFETEPVFTGTEASTAWLSNAERSHRLFGTPAVDTATMQRWIAAWLLRGGSVWGKATGFEVRDGNF